MAIRTIGSVRRRVGIDLGKCIDFNQASSIIPYVIPNSIDNTTDFTFAFWFLARTIDSTTRRILEVGNGYTLLLNSSSLQANVGHATTNAAANTTAGQLRPYTWYRVVVTFTSTDNYPKMYINGVQSTGTNTNKSGSRLSPAGQTAYIGNRAALDRNFDGLIDEHVWYNRLWTDTEIQADYFSNVQPSDSVQVNFHMNETSGDLIDTSSNAITATPSDVTQNTTSHSNGTRTVVSNRFLLPTSSRKSLSFNGTSDLAVTSGITLLTTGFSIGFWVKPDFASAASARIIDWEDTSQTNGFQIIINTSGANRRITTIIHNVTTADVNNSINNNNLDWFHVILTFAPNNAKVFRNTSQIFTDTSCAMTQPSTNLTIGRRASAASNFGKLLICNLTFQNTTTPWTTQQITDLYWRNIIPSGAIQWSMNNTNLDQNGANGLTLTGTSYSTDVPGHMGVRSGV